MYLTADLPGTGGVLKAADDDFQVDELPAYLPSGEGEHVYIHIEKRDLTTREAIRRLAEALHLPPDDIGAAGLKDRHAVTRQWLSLPRPATPEAARALALPGLTILEATRHKNKLKTGHLRGNRFVLVVRELAVPAAEAEARARAIFARLAAPPGAPNFYGAQRFGRAGDNATRGRALLLGDRVEPAPRDGREKRFLLSALQSALFNDYLERRMRDGLYARVIAGDLLQKIVNGAGFPCTDVAAEQPRLEAGEVVPTGPMFGHSMRAPAPGSEAAAREDAILAAHGLTPAAFARHRLMEGTRRPLAIPVGAPEATALADGGLRLAFSLPAGAYATVIAGEVLKTEAAGGPGDEVLDAG